MQIPKPPTEQCPVCSGPLILSRFGPTGPVYYCEHCAIPVLSQDLLFPATDPFHCPQCRSDAPYFTRMTLFGQEYKCHICGKTYVVPEVTPTGRTVPVAPIPFQGAKT